MPAAALPVASGQELPYPAEAPTMRLLEGLALLALDRADEAVRAFTGPVRTAGALLAPADTTWPRCGPRALA